jgi:hypothetical protein
LACTTAMRKRYNFKRFCFHPKRLRFHPKRFCFRKWHIFWRFRFHQNASGASASAPTSLPVQTNF